MQHHNCRGKTGLSGGRQSDMRAASVRRIRLTFYKPITLHASQHLSHRWLFDSGKAREISLCTGLAVLQRDQHRQVTDSKPERLEARLTQAGKPPRSKADEVTWCLQDVLSHNISISLDNLHMHVCISHAHLQQGMSHASLHRYFGTHV